MSNRTLSMCAVVAAVLAGSGCTNYAPTVYPGRVLRYDYLRSESESDFRVDPITVAGQDIAIHITRHRTTTIYERPIHQKVKVYSVEGDVASGKEYFEPIDGQTMPGRETSRVERKNLGDLSDEPFVVNGVERRTDKNGMLIDLDHALLAKFDDMSVNEITIRVKHRRMGTKDLTLTRLDMLRIIGGVTNSDRDVGRQGLAVAVTCPERVQRGETFEIRVKAGNSGPKYCNNLTGRTFSRQAWLHGRNFYIGDLDAGQSREFVRRFTVPAKAQTGMAYVSIPLSDTLGPVAEKQKRMAFRIVP